MLLYISLLYSIQAILGVLAPNERWFMMAKIEQIKKGQQFSCNGVTYRALGDAQKADWNDEEVFVPVQIVSGENAGAEVDFIGMIGEPIAICNVNS
jgi:hypothetical protein